MRWPLFLAVLFALQPAFGQSAPSSSLPSYEMSGSPEDGLQFEVKNFALTQGPDIEAAIEAEAKRRCAPKLAFAGNFRAWPGSVQLGGETVPGMLRFQRTMVCIDPIEPVEPAPADFRPSPDDERDALSAFHAYFKAFDSGDVDAVMRMRDVPSFPRKIVMQDMRENEPYGRAERIPYNTNWIANPSSQSHNGIFAEVLYYQPISKSLVLCGAAMFYRRAQHDYVLSRDMRRTAETSPGANNPSSSVCRPMPVEAAD